MKQPPLPDCVDIDALRDIAKRLEDAAILLRAASNVSSHETRFKLLVDAHSTIKVYGEEETRRQLEITRNLREDN